jgi:hypothetical protein
MLVYQRVTSPFSMVFTSSFSGLVEHRDQSRGAVFALQTTGMSGVSGMMSIHNGSSMEIPSGKFSRHGKQQKYGFS